MNNVVATLNNAGLQINNKWLVKGVSFEVKKGEILTLIGPNAVSYTHLTLPTMDSV